MIERLSHTTLWVTDQQEALEFYTEKLGFEVCTDFTMDNGFRWLTVSPADQNELEIVLIEAAAGPLLDEAAAAQLRALLEKGALGAGVFETSDCQGTFQELQRRGVEFLSEPQERFYGVEATFRDDSGNWFSLTEPTGEGKDREG